MFLNRYLYYKRMKSKTLCPPRNKGLDVYWSTIASFLGIGIISVLDRYSAFYYGNSVLIASFGASAVLTYGAPSADFSQPRNLVGGHLISALIGVTMFKMFSFNLELASALAVSLSIGAMHMTKTLHPPGGATALVAVIGGEEIHNMGYLYIYSPAFVGALIILSVALLVNNLSKKAYRHYPKYWY